MALHGAVSGTVQVLALRRVSVVAMIYIPITNCCFEDGFPFSPTVITKEIHRPDLRAIVFIEKLSLIFW